MAEGRLPPAPSRGWHAVGTLADGRHSPYPGRLGLDGARWPSTRQPAHGGTDGGGPHRRGDRLDAPLPETTGVDGAAKYVTYAPDGRYRPAARSARFRVRAYRRGTRRCGGQSLLRWVETGDTTAGSGCQATGGTVTASLRTALPETTGVLVTYAPDGGPACSTEYRFRVPGGPPRSIPTPRPLPWHRQFPYRGWSRRWLRAPATRSPSEPRAWTRAPRTTSE